MIREGKDITSACADYAQVLVIGSGCGGATVARQLVAAGLSVIMVERGGYYTSERGDFDQRADNMLARIDGGRGLTTSANAEVALMYGNCVGGASVHYWGDSWRLPDDRAARWQSEGVSRHEARTLAPHFEAIERDLNIHVHDARYYNRMNQMFDAAAAKLGWKTEGVPQARRGCISSGHCYQGCAVDAKQSMAVTYVPDFLKRGGKLYADVEAARITRTRDGRATGADCRVIDRATGRPSGVTLRIDADAVVLAAGGYGSPIVWMKSHLPNSSGQVGRNFLCNPNPLVYAMFEEDVVMWENVPCATGTKDFRLARYDEAGRYVEGGYLLHPNQLQPEIMSAVMPGVGADYRELMRNLPRIGSAIAWIDDENGGEISLERDGRIVCDYKMRGDDLLKMRDAMKKQATLLFEAGAHYCFLPDQIGTRLMRREDIAVLDTIDIENGAILHGAPHPSGALRMHDDPRKGVVASTHEAHDVPHLFVADSSVFPSGPSVDPSETIMAFARVAAENVIAKLSAA